MVKTKPFCRAQAGLEYLMTYGWTLVLIVTVASVLFFVFSPGSGSIKCSSSDPTKFPLKAYSFPPDAGHSYGAGYDKWLGSVSSPIELRLQNFTGGKVTLTGLSCYSAFSGSWSDSCFFSVPFYISPTISMAINGVTFVSGGFTPISFNIPVAGGGEILMKSFQVYYRPSGNSVPPGKFKVNYTDQFGYQKDLIVTCDGFPSSLKGTY